MRRTKWFEREFDFSLPVGVFPCVVERLRGTPARLEELVRSLPPRVLTARRGNSWSIQEHVGHLIDLDELHEGRLEALSEAAVAASALHPRLGKQMRVIDMALFVAEHDDHHLATITELGRNFTIADFGLRNAD
ncbi:MAG: hypothetical protein DMF66_12645 [Acidobacteria bacterium]|nr:MAG: hypothetical protein DMF66_12645 [Acidobacteriota bacterium]